jgi:putative SOS response-associated peptidase YedK
MCGRYRLSRRKQLVEEYFDTAPGEEDWVPRYNIAPTQPVPIIRQHPKEPRPELSLVRWGLIPTWAKDASGAAKMINARSETAATKPAFRDALMYRRCLVPTDGFYEWQQSAKSKQPYCDFITMSAPSTRVNLVIAKPTKARKGRSRIW